MDYIDTAIILTLVLITLAEFSVLITDQIIARTDSRKRSFDKWQVGVMQHIGDACDQELSLNAEQKEVLQQHLNSLFQTERKHDKPFLDIDTLISRTLAISSQFNPNASTSFLASDLATRIERNDEESTQAFRLRSGIKATFVAIALSWALNINSLAMIKSLESVPGDQAERLIQEIEKLKTELNIEQDPTTYSEILNKIRIKQNEPSTEIIDVWPVGPLANYPSPITLEWVIGCTLTGLLAGLGAPFWRQQLDRLMVLKKLTKNKVSETVKQPESQIAISIAEPDTIVIPSGNSGSFVASNFFWDRVNKTVEVDVDINGTPENVYTDKELVYTLLARLKPYDSAGLTNVVIRQASIDQIRPALFTHNI